MPMIYQNFKLSQTTPPPPRPEGWGDKDVINANCVEQIATVTDKQGDPVSRQVLIFIGKNRLQFSPTRG